MPFIQMENISHFLRACEAPPLNMHAHDRFLTVDLYESKDPAQVLQCISAFSRVAHAIDAAKFPTNIGPATRPGALSPANSTSFRGGAAARNYTQTPSKSSPLSPSATPLSPALTGGSNTSRTTDTSLRSPKGTVSSWSKKGDQGTTNPAWNIHQYGYMGGASQGNQGVMFGAPRQITTAAPHVPSLAEKERKRKEKELEQDRLRQEAEEAERKRKAELDMAEEEERLAEEQRWESETRRVRDEERKRIEEQKRQWEEQERRWQAEEEVRIKEEAELQRAQSTSDARLKGQFLSQYQAEQPGAIPRSPKSPNIEEDTPERRRVRDLERQLEEARERERQYQLEREERSRHENDRSHPEVESAGAAIARPPSPKDSEASWAPDEREYLRTHRASASQSSVRETTVGSTRPLPSPTKSFQRPLPDPSMPPPPTPNRPLPNPEEYKPAAAAPNRTDRFLASNPTPLPVKAAAHQPAEMGYTSTYEEQKDRERRLASQQKTKDSGWASKSLLEREMERERERQREWEANQQESKTAARDVKEGSGEGQSWDVNQYGYTGGDSQNKGSSTGSGISFGGRRQIIGPRPLP